MKVLVAYSVKSRIQDFLEKNFVGVRTSHLSPKPLMVQYINFNVIITGKLRNRKLIEIHWVPTSMDRKTTKFYNNYFIKLFELMNMTPDVESAQFKTRSIGPCRWYTFDFLIWRAAFLWRSGIPWNEYRKKKNCNFQRDLQTYIL